MLAPWKELKGLPKSIWVLALAIVVNRAGTMAVPFLVLYLNQSLGLSAEEAAMAMGVFGVGGLIVAPVSGWLADQIGSVKVMLWSLLLSGILLLIYPQVHSYSGILVLTFLWALVSEVFRPASFTATAEFVPAEKRKIGFAVVRLAINVGMSIGPALGGFIAHVSFPALFWVDGGTSLVAGLVVGKMLMPFNQINREVGESTSPASFFRASWEALKDSRLIYLFLAVIPVGIVFFQHECTLALYMVNELGLDKASYGALFTVNTVIIILFEIALNLKTAHWSHRLTLGVGAALFGVGFGALMISKTFAAVLATVVIWTVGEMFLFPGLSAYVTDIAPVKRRGTFMGLYSMSFHITFILAPTLGAFLMERFSSQTLWAACLVAGLLSAALLSRVRQNLASDSARR